MGRKLLLGAFALAAIVLAGVLGGVAWSAVSQSSNTISACVLPVRTAEPNMMFVEGRGGVAPSCPSGWSAISWNRIGPRGATGPQGPPGPSWAYSRYREGPINIPRGQTGTGDPSREVLSLMVPGNAAYAVFAKAAINQGADFKSESRVDVRCQLQAGQDRDSSWYMGYLPEGTLKGSSRANIALNLVHSFAGRQEQRISLRCHAAASYAEVRWMKMTAIRVGGITNTQQLGVAP